MGVNYSTIVAVVTASSAVSALCSVLFILTYRYDSVWYEKPENFKDVKTLLCFLRYGRCAAVVHLSHSFLLTILITSLFFNVMPSMI